MNYTQAQIDRANAVSLEGSFINLFRAEASSDDEDDRLIVVRKITKLYGIFGNAAKKLASDR